MVTVRSIAAGEEIFNTYGVGLGNAALLARYGFLLEGGETDVVTFGWHGSGLVTDTTHLQHSLPTATVAHLEGLLENSALVSASRPKVDESVALYINSDGQVSLDLFLWALMDALARQLPSDARDAEPRSALVEDIDYEILRVARALVELEEQVNGHGISDNDADMDEHPPIDDLVRFTNFRYF